MAGMTRWGSLRGASETKQMPLAKFSLSSCAICKPRRVLPTPPVPVSVSRHTPGRRKSVQATAVSRSRPTRDVSCMGRLKKWTFAPACACSCRVDRLRATEVIRGTLSPLKAAPASPCGSSTRLPLPVSTAAAACRCSMVNVSDLPR